MFSKILETFIFAQKTGILNNIQLTLGNVTKIINIKVPYAFIIGDMQGGDKICCSAPSYSKILKRICHNCNVSGSDVGNQLVDCQYIHMDHMQQLILESNVDVLNKLCQYNVYTPFYDIDYGSCKFGIFSAAMPVESLHALENGLIQDALDVLFKQYIIGKKQVRLDSIAKKIQYLDHQYYISAGSQKEMPTLMWKNGISYLSFTKASEKVGMMLTIVILSIIREGNDFLNEVFNKTIS